MLKTSQTKCSHEGCEKLARAARGMCSAHYMQWWRGPSQLATRPKRICTHEGCERRLIARGMCSMHYLKWWRGDDFHKTQPGRVK